MRLRAALTLRAKGRAPKDFVAALDAYTDSYARMKARDPAAALAYFRDLFARIVASKTVILARGRAYLVADVFLLAVDGVEEVWMRLEQVADSVTRPR